MSNHYSNFHLWKSCEKTQENCIEAFAYDIKNFRSIPKCYRTEEMLIKAFKLIDRSQMTQDICSKAFAYDITNFPAIPNKFRNRLMYIQAFKSGAYNIANIPQKYFTQKFSNYCIKKSPNYLMYIPTQFRTEKICKKAFKYDHNNIKYIPYKHITYNMLSKVKVCVCIENYLLFPKYFIYKFAKLAIKNDVRYITKIPKKYITKRFWIKTCMKYDIYDTKIQNFLIDLEQTTFSTITYELAHYKISYVIIKNNYKNPGYHYNYCKYFDKYILVLLAKHINKKIQTFDWVSIIQTIWDKINNANNKKYLDDFYKKFDQEKISSEALDTLNQIYYVPFK